MKSVGEVLKAERKKRKLAIENIQKAIKIHPKYIKALEENDYSVFDDKVHAKGFVKIYASFLGLNVSEILAFWRRDFETFFESKTPKKFSKFKSLESAKFVITPSFVFLVALGVLLFVFFGYLFYQYKNFNAPPSLNVPQPENNVVVNTDIVDVVGSTDIGNTVFVNNQEVALNSKGEFAASVRLKEGINTLNIFAVNKLEKKTEVLRTVIYRPLPKLEEEFLESTESTGSML